MLAGGVFHELTEEIGGKKNLSPSCTVGFVFIIAFNSYSTPTHMAGISNPFYRWGKWGSKRTWLSKEWNRDMNLFPMLIPLISSASVGSCHVCWDSPAKDRGLIQGNILRARETHLHVGGVHPVLKVTLQLLGSWWSVVVYPVPGRDLDPRSWQRHLPTVRCICFTCGEVAHPVTVRQV